jgi:nucleotide-binding universal stress UspA family protein
MTGPGYGIVVGVDDSDNSLIAVDAAATEATLRHQPLHVIHADPFEPAAETTAGPLPEAPGRWVNRAMERALAAWPDLKVTGEVARGFPQAALIKASSNAELVVIGDRALGAVARALLETVAGGLVRYAACPVLVTRGLGVPDGPVVVGVDGSPNSQAAVRFAFAEADLRCRPLVIVHAWSRPGPHRPGSALPRDFAAASIQTGAERLVSEATVGLHEDYPGVATSHLVVHGHPRQALVEAGGSASLLVVGAHGQTMPPVPEPGSVSRHLVYHAPCPVVIVPAPRAETD